MLQFVVKFWVNVIVVLPIYLILRKPWKRFEKREIYLGMFIVFMAGLLTVALEGTYGTPAAMLESAKMRIASGKNMNMVPFHTVRRFLKCFTWDTFLVNIVGNIVMFMPWGFGLVLLWKKNHSVWRIAMWSFLLTAFIETCQLFIGRSVDVDDLILNFIGGCLGAALYFGIRRFVPQIEELARNGGMEG